jgi:hypothetical protein
VAPTLGNGVGVGFGVGVAIVGELAEGDASAPLVADGVTAATEQPASSPAAARPTAKTLSRPDRASW